MGKASPLLSIISRRSALKLFGAAAMTAFGTAALTGCRANTPTSHSPVRLLVKVPRTGHDVVFDDSINEVSQVITAMGEAFESCFGPAGEECEGAGVRAEPVRQRHCRQLRHGQGGRSFSTAITSTYQPIFIPAAWFHWTTS